MASRERLAAAGLGRALTTEAVSQVAADVGVCVRPVLRRVTDRQTGAVEQVTLPCGSTRESVCGPCAAKARRSKRGRVPLSQVAEDWFQSRHSVKRKTREADRAAWKSHIEARFGDAPVASITPAEIAHWVGGLVSGGISPSTASRYLATLRSILAYAVADGRVSQNAAASVRAPTAGHVRREGQFLTREELDELATACRGVYADVVKILGLAGLRWGELAGLQVGDRVAVPGQGLRLQRSVLASSKGGELFVDTLKGKRSRTVPLVAELVP